MKKLNLGSGAFPLKGWKNIDINKHHNPDECYDIGAGIMEQDNSVDEILLSHVLMYFPAWKARRVLGDCYRILKIGGQIRITEDNRHLKKRSPEQQKQYGEGQLFDRLEMRESLRTLGFSDIEDCDPFHETRQHGMGLSNNYPLAQGRASVYFLSAEKLERSGPSVYLGLDDFGETNSQMDILWGLRDYFDDFKVNLFAIPNHNMRYSWLAYMNSLKWIRLCVHGYNHTHFEELDEVTLSILGDKKHSYFEKVYKAPFWELSTNMKDRLDMTGYKVVTKEMMTWEIDKPLINPQPEPIHAYGHVYPDNYQSVKGSVGSSLSKFAHNIKKLPRGTKFRFYEALR